MSYRAKYFPLADICAVQTGYTARGRLEPVAEAGIPAVQLRDLTGEEPFDPAGATRYALPSSFERYWAGPGDVLFRSRGERNTAVVVDPHQKLAAVAILPLIILRPHAELVTGEYLAWVINQEPAQLYFDKWARGQKLRMIPKGRLDDLEVPVPDLTAQRTIVEIDCLARRERALAHEHADKRFTLTRFALLEQMRKARPHGNGTGQSVARQTVKSAGKPERTNKRK